ncbi:MAG: thioredoxin family protein [Thermoplasmata archaeon]|jgi:hypothetical protein|nr:thioredoxin family protein [Thermoplasmata archaeon]
MNTNPCCPGRTTTKRIKVEGVEVGISNYDGILGSALAIGSGDESHVKEVIMRGLKESNYIPREAEGEYLDSMYDEYLGLKDRMERARACGFVVEVFVGPTCSGTTHSAVEEALTSAGFKAEVVKVTDAEVMAARGVADSPALAINGKIVSAGKELRQADVTRLLKASRGGL